MFLARMVFFRLHESPRYLVGAGRPQEALESLQMISKFNGSDMPIVIDDVSDIRPQQPQSIVKQDQTLGHSPSGSGSNYASTQESSTVLDGHTYATPVVEYSEPTYAQNAGRPTSNVFHDLESNHPIPATAAMPSPVISTPRPRPRIRSTSSRRMSRRSSSVYEKRVCSSLPPVVRRPLWAWWDRVMMVLTPEWLRTTTLVWGIWFGMSLGA